MKYRLLTKENSRHKSSTSSSSRFSVEIFSSTLATDDSTLTLFVAVVIGARTGQRRGASLLLLRKAVACHSPRNLSTSPLHASSSAVVHTPVGAVVVLSSPQSIWGFRCVNSRLHYALRCVLFPQSHQTSGLNVVFT